MELDHTALVQDAAWGAVSKDAKLADRTGVFSAVQYVSDETRVYEHYAKERLHLMIYEAILHALSDGRTYVVKVGKVETYEEDNTTQYRLSAIVALHKPDEAEIGEWVHLASLTAGPKASIITLAVTPEPSNDVCSPPYLATFERHKLGWKRVR